jgi:hypothetical protein
MVTDRSRARSLLWIAAVGGMLLAGCAAGGASPSVQITHPAGDALVLRVTSQGGFLAPAAGFAELPGISVLGNGRVIVPGAVDTIYPGPALPPLLVRRLSEAGIQALLREVLGSGLFTRSRSFDGARSVVADAPTTLFSLHANGRDVSVSIYGLGTLDSANPPPGIGGEEVAAYRALTKPSERLGALDRGGPCDSGRSRGWR